jgi:hypothetical protein
VSCGPSKNTNAKRCSRGAELLVERGERQCAPLRELQVGGVIESEPEAVGEGQRFAPGKGIRVWVGGDVQEREIGERGAAEVCCQFQK